MCCSPFAPIQILTGDTRKGCVFRHSRLLDERRSFRIKLRIERRFESSPESRGSQTSGVLFGYFLHDAKSDNSFPFREAPRFFKPRNSTHKQQLRTKQIKSFFRLTAVSRLLETWSPCSHPFAILPVSAVSDAQKLATGNFLHVRAAFFLLLTQHFSPPLAAIPGGFAAIFPFPQFLTVEKLKITHYSSVVE